MARPTKMAKLEDSMQRLNEQALLVLADYQNMSAEFVRTEGIRLEIAKRIVDNARLIFGLPIRRG